MEIIETVDSILGKEFLTWLWYKSETNSGSYEDMNGKSFSIFVTRKVVVEGGEDNNEVASSCGENSRLSEAMHGLKCGKHVTSATVVVELDTLEYTAKLSADISKFFVKYPSFRDDDVDYEDDDAAILDRLYLTEQFISCIDAAYKQFVILRTSQEWQEETKKIRQWIEAN